MPALTIPLNALDHAQGPADAPVTLVEYGDFECGYCATAAPVVRAVQRRLGNRLRFVYRHFPLAQVHPHARHAAEAAEEAGVQGAFWRMHDALFEDQTALADDRLIATARRLGLDAARMAAALAQGTHADRVRADFRGGVRSGVNGTPTFYINGERWDGAWADEDELIRALRFR